MGAEQSRLTKAGGNRQQAIAGLLADPSPVVAAARAKYANDPAGFAAWENSKINETTKGKYSGVLGGAVKLISKAAPLAALIPGVGIPLAAGIGAAGRLAGGEGVKGALVGGLEGGAGAALLGGKGIGGVSALAKKATSSQGILTRAIDYAKRKPLQAAQIGLGAASAIQGAKRQGQADTLLQGATNRVSTVTPRVDLTDMFADPGNPYALGRTGPNRAALAARAALGG